MLRPNTSRTLTSSFRFPHVRVCHFISRRLKDIEFQKLWYMSQPKFYRTSKQARFQASGSISTSIMDNSCGKSNWIGCSVVNGQQIVDIKSDNCLYLLQIRRPVHVLNVALIKNLLQIKIIDEP